MRRLTSSSAKSDSSGSGSEEGSGTGGLRTPGSARRQTWTCGAIGDALKLSREFKDAYVSNEIVGLALHTPQACGELFEKAGCNAATLRTAVKKLRGE